MWHMSPHMHVLQLSCMCSAESLLSCMQKNEATVVSELACVSSTAAKMSDPLA